MIKQTEDQIVDHLLKTYDGQKLIILAPVVKGRKGHYRELFVQIRKMGFTKVRVNGEIQDLVAKMQVDRYKTHDIEIVVDRVIVQSKDEKRIRQSVQAAFKQSDGILMAMAGFSVSYEDLSYSAYNEFDRQNYDEVLFASLGQESGTTSSDIREEYMRRRVDQFQQK